MSRLTYTHEHHQFRELVRDFVRQTVAPNHESWERDGQWDRSLFIEAGKLGLLGFSVPEHLGGPGVDDFRYNAIVIDELQRPGRPRRASPSRCKTTWCCPISPT
ncbi:acyl-CoA dehydrogenase, N-terminal domain protein [Mycobacterium intracellulare 1956]|uniref:Acyl-CoA dehydrogenase, N-terminal domain protein n=1 Tax=Mycobacterium intracellulare 1956 TaxID=1299331 RepID=X8CCH1_MYCIT|nr:acyl-CoA dehydrogenase, N-terminal domain protein [Mycobacterium intracellulare 1956]